MTVEDAGARPLAGRLGVGPGAGRGRAVALRVAGRVAKAVSTLVGVAVVVFIVLRLLPGNQITSSLGVNAELLTKAQYADLEHYYGIGKPLPQQFGQWAGDLLRGNMGVCGRSARMESDYAVAQGVTLVFALGFITVNLLTDLLYAVVDPRLRS
jgi:peptide/nickel transport system permease protein